MPKIVTCDTCGKEGFEDENYGYVCEYHYLIQNIRCLKDQYEEHKKWVIKCQISRLKEMRREIKETEKRIKELEGEQNE
jgi:ribosomal protein L37E